MAVSEDEQAVSTAMLGPLKSRHDDTRLATDQYPDRRIGVAGSAAWAA